MHVMCLWQKHYFRIQALCVVCDFTKVSAEENVYFIKSPEKKGQR